jgi:hypothetical protein
MLGLGTIAKMAKGAMGVDELSELLSQAIGGEVEITPLQSITPQEVVSKMGGAWAEGTKSILITGTSRTKERLTAVIVLSPPQGKPFPSPLDRRTA